MEMIIKKYLKPVLDGKNPKRGIYLILVIGGVSIFILPVLFTIKSCLPSFKETGSIGDTINGIAGPFIAIAAATLTFLAFFAQFTANRIQLTLFKEQKKQFEIQLNEQQKTEKIERFENRFYELLKVQREIVSEMNVGKSKRGASCFVSFFYEFRYTYLCIEECLYIDEVKPKDDLKNAGLDKKEALLQIAYTIFFLGIGPNSDILIQEILNKLGYREFTDIIIKTLKSKLFEKSPLDVSDV